MEFRPEYYLVMESLASGVKTVEEVAGHTGLAPHDVEAVVNALLGQGLVERREKGLIFKKEAYVLSERGWEVLSQWREEVRRRIDQAAQLRGEERAAALGPIEAILPALLAMGVIDMATWSLLSRKELDVDFEDVLVDEF